jgi:hypothetical protein
MKDDLSLHDEQLEDEIRLVGDLVLAASQSEGPMPDEAIDEVLGLHPPTAPDDAVPARGGGDERAAAPGDPASVVEP